jgi:hypothetical protein
MSKPAASVFGLALAAALCGPPPALHAQPPGDKGAAARLEKLESRVKELEAQVNLLKDPEARAAARAKEEREAGMKYMKAAAESYLEAAISGDDRALQANLSKEMRTVGGSYPEGTQGYSFNLANWANGVTNAARADSFTITEETVAPGLEEGIYRGTLKRQDGKATFTVRVVKDKESGRYWLGMITIKPE